MNRRLFLNKVSSALGALLLCRTLPAQVSAAPSPPSPATAPTPVSVWDVGGEPSYGAVYIQHRDGAWHYLGRTMNMEMKIQHARFDGTRPHYRDHIINRSRPQPSLHLKFDDFNREALETLLHYEGGTDGR